MTRVPCSPLSQGDANRGKHDLHLDLPALCQAREAAAFRLGEGGLFSGAFCAFAVIGRVLARGIPLSDRVPLLQILSPLILSP